MSTSEKHLDDKDRQTPDITDPTAIPPTLSVSDHTKLLSVDKLKALLKSKRGLLTRGLKAFENYLQSDFDQQLILKSYEKVSAIKVDLDQLIDQLCSIDDFPSSDLTDELKTHETYSINFEKLEELYFEHMNKVFKQNEILDNIHKSYRQAAETTPGSAGSKNEEPNRSNIKYKPIEIPTFDPAKTEILSFHDWWALFQIASSALPDFSMKSCLLQQSLAGESRNLIKSLPLNEIGFNEAINLLHSNYANIRKTFQVNIKKVLSYQPPTIDKRREQPSKTLRMIWSELQCMIRAIENCSRQSWEDDNENPLSSDDILQVIVLSKLPYTLAKDYEYERETAKVATLNDMFHLLSEIISRREITELNVPERRVNTVCGAIVNQNSTQQQYPGKYQNNSTPKTAGLGTSICKFCAGPHNTSRCTDSSIDIKTRKDVVRAKGLCRNCLNSRHMASQCLSTGRCRNCGQQHHTLLCEKASAPNDHSNQLNPSVAPFIPIQDETNSG